MKKTLIFATAAAAAFASAANAHSNLMLYGIVDTALVYVNDVSIPNNVSKPLFRLQSGIDNSYFGISGTENLNEYVKTFFKMESSFSLNNGRLENNNHLFSREVYFGISTDSGSISVGRQYDSGIDYLSPLLASGSWGGIFFAGLENFNNLEKSNAFLRNNSVKFTSANYNGFQFGGVYGHSNVGDIKNNRVYSAGFSYDLNGMHLGGSYVKSESECSFKYKKNCFQLFNSQGTSDFSDTLNRIKPLESFGFGVSYDLGSSKIGGALNYSTIENTNEVLGHKPSSISTLEYYELNVRHEIMDDLYLGAMYNYSRFIYKDQKQDALFNEIGTQIDYVLSKETDVYGEFIYQKLFDNETISTIHTGYGLFSPAHIQSDESYQFAILAGIRHRF